jgi:penicillin amidase
LRIVGLMIPGLPVVAVGRNPWIAWGGTNLHAASSDLFDVTDLPPEQVRERQESIRMRWGRPRRVTIRETDQGPILSDSPLLQSLQGRDLALAWVGHRASDEVSAMLAMMRARS